MIDKIVGFAIKQRVAVVILTLFLLAFGVWQASKLPINAEPDVTNTQVVVSALDPALGPQELEKRVTFPLELALAGMPHLEHMESVSQYGLAQVRCYFDEQVNLYTARAYVTARIQNVQGQLPGGINATMLPDTTGTGEIVHIRIAGGPMTLMQRRSYADWTLRPQLMQVKEIADVNVLGGQIRQWQVQADPEKLAMRGLSISDVDSALSANNNDIGGSFLNQGAVERIVRGVGFVQSLDDIRQIVVGAKKRHSGDAGAGSDGAGRAGSDARLGDFRRRRRGCACPAAAPGGGEYANGDARRGRQTCDIVQRSAAGNALYQRV